MNEPIAEQPDNYQRFAQKYLSNIPNPPQKGRYNGCCKDYNEGVDACHNAEYFRAFRTVKRTHVKRKEVVELSIHKPADSRNKQIYKNRFSFAQKRKNAYAFTLLFVCADVLFRYAERFDKEKNRQR